MEDKLAMAQAWVQHPFTREEIYPCLKYRLEQIEKLLLGETKKDLDLFDVKLLQQERKLVQMYLKSPLDLIEELTRQRNQPEEDE